MLKLKYLASLVLATLLFVACDDGATPPPTEEPLPATPILTLTATAISTPTEATDDLEEQASTLAAPLPTAFPVPTAAPSFLEIQPDDWIYGPMEAFVTVVVYNDFQCSTCGTLASWLKRLQETYPGDVRLIFRHYPLINNHDKAQLAAEAAEAAGAQGAFWEMHDRLFEDQRRWSTVTLDQAGLLFIDYATQLGLDAERFAADLEKGTYRDKLQDCYQETIEQELSGIPTIFINGQLFQAPLSYNWLDTFIQLALLARRQYASPPPMTLDPQKSYQAVIKTEKGDIVVALDDEHAPVTVNNFVFLARQGWYDGTTFFWVQPDFVAQAGDPTNTGLGNPGYELPAEIGLPHGTGAIAMARRPDPVNPEKRSDGSQFYITLKAIPQLDGAYTVFGDVIAGIEVVHALTPRDASQNPGLPPGDKIITIEIQEISRLRSK